MSQAVGKISKMLANDYTRLSADASRAMNSSTRHVPFSFRLRA